MKLFLIACLLLVAHNSIAQSRPLSESDKRMIFRAVLLDYDFRSNAEPDGTPVRVSLLTGSIPPRYLLKRRGVKFQYIGRETIDRQKNAQHDIDYYEFGKLMRRKGSVYLRIDWTSRLAFSNVEYEFRKVGGRWRIHSIAGGYGVAKLRLPPKGSFFGPTA
jgi:hypothetical protein